MGFKLRPGISLFGNMTFTPDDVVNFPPSISNILSEYTLVPGEDIVITADGVDLNGDPITWSYAESSDLNGSTVSQSDNVFTISPAQEPSAFQLSFTATDPLGAASTFVSSFLKPLAPAMRITTEYNQPFSLSSEVSGVTLHHDIHSNTGRDFASIWQNVTSSHSGISASVLDLDDGIPNSHYSFRDNLVQITLSENPYEKGTTIKFVNNDLYMTQNLGGGWKQLWNLIGSSDNTNYANFVDFSDADMDYFYIAGGNSYNHVPASWFDKSSNDGWHTHKIQFKTSGYEYYIDDNLVYDNAYVSPGSTWRFVLFSSRGEIKQVKMYGLEVFVDGE